MDPAAIAALLSHRKDTPTAEKFLYYVERDYDAVGSVRVPKTGNPVDVSDWTVVHEEPYETATGRLFVHVWATSMHDALRVALGKFSAYDRKHPDRP